MSAIGCTACASRRRAGLEGQCPACANERARQSRAAERPGWRRDPDGTVRWSAPVAEAPTATSLAKAIAVAFDRALRHVVDHPAEAETIAKHFATWVRGNLDAASVHLEAELIKTLEASNVYPPDGREAVAAFRPKLRALLGLP